MRFPAVSPLDEKLKSKAKLSKPYYLLCSRWTCLLLQQTLNLSQQKDRSVAIQIPPRSDINYGYHGPLVSDPSVDHIEKI